MPVASQALGRRERNKQAKLERITAAASALVTPVVECNRVQVDNGRTYLREMAFGDPTEPHHAEALSIVVQTEDAVAGILNDRAQIAPAEASTLARVVTAIMF